MQKSLESVFFSGDIYGLIYARRTERDNVTRFSASVFCESSSPTPLIIA